ncbi:hypothetical protein WMF30_02800 [Sorangium sp. So ce134]
MEYRTVAVQSHSLCHGPLRIPRRRCDPTTPICRSPVAPDPERRWYRQFGVERSTLAGAHPKVVWSAIRGIVGARSNAFHGEGGKDGLPADFLVGPDGALLDVHYGAHAADHWELEQVIALARAIR